MSNSATNAGEVVRNLNNGTMRAGTSLWLDLTRLGAALTVLVVHLTGYTRNNLRPMDKLGAIAVVTFFVLSGYVIASTVRTKEKTLAEYAAARLARLWSILLPALALTYVFDSVGIYIDPASYTGLGVWPEPFASPLSLLPAAFFLNEIWFFPVTPLSNTPVWSLGFEGWYYLIFGAFVFLRGKTRWLASGCLTTIAGPSIALLFPTWLLGAAAYHASRRYRISESVGWILFAAPIPILTVWLVTKPGKWLPVLPFELFRHSTEGIFFIVLAFAISLHFVGVSAVDARLKRLLMKVAAPIRAGAAYTLSIYLFHFPILLMVSSLLSKLPPGLPRATITGALTLAASVGLGMIFEPQRFPLRERLLNLFGRQEAIPK